MVAKFGLKTTAALNFNSRMDVVREFCNKLVKTLHVVKEIIVVFRAKEIYVILLQHQTQRRKVCESSLSQFLLISKSPVKLKQFLDSHSLNPVLFLLFETQVPGLEPGDGSNMISSPLFCNTCALKPLGNQHRGGYRMLTTFLPSQFNVTITFLVTYLQHFSCDCFSYSDDDYINELQMSVSSCSAHNA